MNGATLRDARESLGLSITQMAERLRLAMPNGRTMLREMESGKRDVSGPISVAVELMLKEQDGAWPQDDISTGRALP